MLPSLPPSRRSRRGGTAVEMAIVLPALLTIAFGCLDYGRTLRGKIALSNAARVGAEYGATHRFTTDTRPAWETAIRTAAQDEAASIPGYTPAGLNVSIQTTTDAGGAIRVRVSATMSFRTLIRWPGIPTTIALRHEVAKRQYQ